MQSNFINSFNFMLGDEGGFVDNPDDPGGATNLGVTLNAWKQFAGDDQTVDDLKALTPADVQPFYESKYWHALGCDQLPSGLDYCVFDFGVNSGVHRAAITLQIVVGSHLDGIIGPNTIECANRQDADIFINDYQKHRLDFLNGLEGSKYFGKGWDARVARVKQRALEM